jgi:hypothetical protein
MRGTDCTKSIWEDFSKKLTLMKGRSGQDSSKLKEGEGRGKKIA